MNPAIRLPRLYPVLDAGRFFTEDAVLAFAEELMAGGATLIQYRNKSPDTRTALEHLRGLRRITANRSRLIVNDRVDLCLAAECDGVHLGQDDLHRSRAANS